MRKRIFLMLVLLFTALGLCACSAKVNQDNQNPNAANDEIGNEQIDDFSVAESSIPAIDVSIDEERIIQDQSFDVELSDWGNVRFISYEPDNSNDFEDVSFFLMKDNHIVYSFPYYCENNSTENYVGLYDSVAAVDFRDVNNDDIKDVIVIISYVTGAGPQGMIPRPRARIFLADKKEFYLAADLIDDITDNIEEKDLAIATICEYIKNK